MEKSSHLAQAELLLKPLAESIEQVDVDRLDVYIKPSNLLSAIESLVKASWGYLSAITGLDEPTPFGTANATKDSHGKLEVLYHFCNKHETLTLRVVVPHENAVVPSICSIIPSATLYERELAELFGIEVKGTPDPSRLVLPDDWPCGVYPLRKSFAGLNSSQASSEA